MSCEPRGIPTECGIAGLEGMIETGASPRASIELMKAAKAHAFLQSRGYVTPHDVKSVAMEILRHRVILTYEAEAEGQVERRHRPEDPGQRAGTVRGGRASSSSPSAASQIAGLKRHRPGRYVNAVGSYELNAHAAREVIQRVREIQVRTGRQVADVLAGQYVSVFKGRGIEFDEVRPYVRVTRSARSTGKSRRGWATPTSSDMSKSGS